MPPKPKPRVRPKTAPVVEAGEQPVAAVTPPPRAPSPGDALIPPAAQTLLAALLNQQRQTDQMYHLVVIPEDDWPRVEAFECVTELITVVRELLGTSCHLFPFLGQRLIVTRGPNRFLRTPLGALPLFEIPEGDSLDDEEFGWVGPSLDKNVAPTDPLEEDFDDEETDESDETADGGDAVDGENVPGPPAIVSTGDTPMFDD